MENDHKHKMKNSRLTALLCVVIAALAAMSLYQRAEIWKIRQEMQGLTIHLESTRTPKVSTSDGSRAEKRLTASSDVVPPRDAERKTGQRPEATLQKPSLKSSGSRIAAIANDPRLRELYLRKVRIDLEASTYPFFKLKGISKEVFDLYANSVVEGEQVILDAQAEAEKNGLSLRDVEAIVGKAHQELAVSIKETLGEEVYNELIAYNQAQPFRAIVGDLAGKMIYSSEPMSSHQATQYLTILETNRSALKRVPSGFILPEQVLAALQGILTPQQLAAIRAQQASLITSVELNGPKM